MSRWLATAVRDEGVDTEVIGVAATVKSIETMRRNTARITEGRSHAAGLCAGASALRGRYRRA